jgi:inner membrane protein
MASLITHPAIPLAVATIVGRRLVPWPLLALGVVFSMLPDLDVLGFRYGIPYASPYGHRGCTHSVAIAALAAALFVPFARGLGAAASTTFVFLFASMASHGILDAFTDAGMGVAFGWPFSDHRTFFSFRPIEASPVSLHRFLSSRGWEVLRSELTWVWAPLAALTCVAYGVRKVGTS